METIFGFLKIDLDRNRIYGLDILRAIAILFVVLIHGCFILPERFSSILKYFILDGISIFFVLSGFLIGGILIRLLERKDVTFNSLLNFWKNRWLRTLPAYYFTLILLIIINFSINRAFNIWDIKSYFFFLQNFNQPHPGFFPEAWSLSIEEWFYLMIPLTIVLLVYFFHSSVGRTVLFTAISIIFLTTFFRFFRYLQAPGFPIDQWDLLFRKQVITRLDGLMFGVLGAYAIHYHRILLIRFKSVFFYAGILIIFVQHVLYLINGQNMGLFQCVFSFSVTSVGVFFLLPYLSELKTGKGFIYKAITLISLISYSMYLLNLSVIQCGLITIFDYSYLHKLHLAALTKYFLFWTFTLGGSVLMYIFIEKPFLKMRSNLFTRPASR